MSARFPKPSPSPKQPRRIKRSTPIERRSAPRKKRKGKRASIARECDRLCGAIVRSRGSCEGDHHGKGGRLQWAHGFSRRYRAVRWLPINGFCLCAGCHFYYTTRPLEFDNWLRLTWGLPTYFELRRMAEQNSKQDMTAVLERLRAEAQRLGVA